MKKTHIALIVVVVVVVVVVVPLLVGLLLPAFQPAIEYPGHLRGPNVIKQLTLSLLLHTHHDGMHAFPAQATFDEDGKPLLSWRVKVLPYIEERTLYDKFVLDEPWNSDLNAELLDQKRAWGSFHTSHDLPPGVTNIVAVVGDDTVIDREHSNRIEDITDSLDETIVLVEVDPARAVPWSKPADYEPDPNDPAAGLGLPEHDYFITGFANGAVRNIPKSIDPQALNAMFTKSGGEKVDLVELGLE